MTACARSCTGCALLVVAAVAGCRGASADDKPLLPPPQKPDQRFEHDMMVRFHMHENFDLLRAIEKLLVHGKLDEARTLAKSVAYAPDEPGLEPFARRAATVRERAAAVANAPSLDEALRREAKLAQACAECHADAGVLPEFREPPRVPPDKPTIEARMTRHLWATDRLWEGVVGDSNEAWRAGLDVLAATPLPWSTADSDRVALARQLQRLADQARQTQGADRLDERARLYGEILVTCAACHTAKP